MIMCTCQDVLTFIRIQNFIYIYLIGYFIYIFIPLVNFSPLALYCTKNVKLKSSIVCVFLLLYYHYLGFNIILCSHCYAYTNINYNWALHLLQHFFSYFFPLKLVIALLLICLGFFLPFANSPHIFQ